MLKHTIMKTRFCLLMSLLLAASLIKAQELTVPKSKDLQKAKSETTKQVTSQANLGGLVGQLTENLSDKAFTDEFKKKKDDFTKSAGNTKDAAGLSSSLQTLQGGLLPTAMDAGWGAVKGKWIKDAKTANTIKTVAGLTQTLESHISPSAFKGDWVKTRPAWESALGSLAK
jgi:hypothetical protein